MSIRCAACRHEIDEAARLCPYCGADPRSGQKIIDTEAMLRAAFMPKRASGRRALLDLARRHQGMIVAVAMLAGFLALAGLYQFAVRRNSVATSADSGVPMTEVTDVVDQSDENRPLPMPSLQFQYDGRPQAMRTCIVEQTAPPAPVPTAPQRPTATR